MLLLGFTLLALASPPFFNFPLFGFWLLPIGMIYLLFLLISPRLWLIVLPILTVLLDLAPWSGRFVYNEYDWIFLLTLASGLLYNRYRLSVFAPSPAMIALLSYLAVAALGYSGWIYFLSPPQAAWENPYYSEEYAYKVAKGMIWGISLVPMWAYLLAVDKQRAVNALVVGVCLAAVCFGVLTLWERGTLGVLLSWSAWYHVVSSLLDLSSSYRVTALFSDMHTGGEAYDGVLLLLLPATMYGVVYGKHTWIRVLGVLGFSALAYATLVGFTRTTYAAFALSVGCFSMLTLWSRHRSGLEISVPLGWLIATLFVGAAAATLAFRLAGSYGLASYGGLVLLACAPGFLPMRGFRKYLPPMLAFVLIMLAVNAHFTSRWATPSWLAALLVALALGGAYILAYKFFKKIERVSQFNRLLFVGASTVLPALLAFALGGYQMGDRLTRVSSDLESRTDHWLNVIDSVSAGPMSRWLGSGLGSFPGSYIASHADRVQDVGSFRVVQEVGRDSLRLGAGSDLTIGQRITVEPNADYTVKVRARAEKNGRLHVALCERNMIYASNFMPRCESGMIRFNSSDGKFELYSIVINSGGVGKRGPLRRWPTLFTVRYSGKGTVVEIDALELEFNGYNVLRNGGFADGLDYWFYYNDFSHLPWHVKNTFLLVWFETGWLGLALFIILLGLLVRTNFHRHAHDSLAPVYTAGVVIVCIFGLFGSPLDSARASWMFYFFLCAGLVKLRRGKRSRVTGTTRTSLSAHQVHQFRLAKMSHAVRPRKMRRAQE